MKKYLLLLAALLGNAASAAEPAKAPAKPAPAAGAAWNEPQFEAAYQHLKTMLAQMDRIKATRDPQERQRLLQEHRHAMRDGALALRRGECKEQPCPMMYGGRHGGHDRVAMMERRMDMMQLMMEQMIEHENQRALAPQQDGARR